MNAPALNTSGSAPVGAPPPVTRSTILLLIGLQAIGPLSLNILVPALPRLATEFRADAGTVQLTVSLYILGLAASQLLLGPMSDRFGRRPVMLAGMALATVSSIAALLATNIGSLIAARLLQALGASTGIVVGRAMIRDVFERDQAASMMGLVTMAMAVAPMIAPLIGGILDTALGWYAIFGFSAVASAVMLCWATFALPETRVRLLPSSGPYALWGETRHLISSRTFIGYTIAGALGSAPFFLLIGGAPYVVVTVMHRTSAEYGLWFALSSVGYMVGNFIAARLSVRHGVFRMVWAGIVLEIVGSIIALLAAVYLPAAGPGIIFLPQLVTSCGSGLLLPNAIAGAISVRPHASGTAAGISGFFQMAIGAASAQAISHALVTATSAEPLAWYMIAPLVVCAVAFWALVRR